MNASVTGRVAACILLAVSLPASATDGNVEVFTDNSSGLLSWKATHPTLSLQFIQLLPDYVRAVYSARGLPEKVVELMAGYCVFGTIIKNESAHRVSYRVGDWRYTAGDDKPRPIKTKTQWLEQWRDMGVAFRWSLLPDDQTFEPGDWSQGFTTLPLPPDTPVSITYQWTEQGITHEDTFENLHCAPAQPPKR